MVPLTSAHGLRGLSLQLKGVLNAVLVQLLARLQRGGHGIAVATQHIEGGLPNDGHKVPAPAPLNILCGHLYAPHQLHREFRAQ